MIGVDIGTTSITGLVYNCKHKSVLVSGTVTGETEIGSGQAWERLQDPEIILRRVLQLLGQLQLQYPDIAGIGLTGQMHGIVYTDKEGQHVSPLYTWQDGRGGLAYDDARSYAGHLSAVTGTIVAPGYGLATHYYNERQGLVPPEAVSFCTIADYVSMRLTGRKSPLIEATQAAGIGGFDLQLGDFQRSGLEQAGIRLELLPEIAPSGSLIGHTPRGVPVFTSVGDNQASFMGSVRRPADTALVNIGTGSQLSVWLEDAAAAAAISAEGMELRPYPGGGALLVGAALSGGKSYALLESFFRQVIGAYTGHAPGELYSFMEWLAHSEPGPAGGLTVNTQFLGTRRDPGARGSISGISPDNFTPGSFIHGFQQGMVDELYSFYEQIRKSTDLEFTAVTGSGNALRANPALCAKVQATFGLPLLMSAAKEEAAVGAALYAAVAAGGIPGFIEAGRRLPSAAAAGASGPVHPPFSRPEAPVSPQHPPLDAETRARLMRTYGLTPREQIIRIQPGASIGPLILGLTRAELEAAAEAYPGFYKAEFDEDGRAVFIEIADPGEGYICRLPDCEADLFHTKAEELIPLLDDLSPYDREDPELGYTYRFPDLGVTFWRPIALTEADLLTEEYLALPPDILEDEKRQLYFESISVWKV
ncbi:sedoheptulokinase [Paenibacillus tengchongensis]|uniref:sedoheptulokinase n=1 Tax=Paenibacillus tengchongensis TaxID=2608684 RepID=UPI001FE52872|nr:FGGY family carbohydrate kinase [Paenibacillus tengchongensis]